MSVPPGGISEPPRKETLLARYPRNVKIGVTLVLLALMISPFLIGTSSTKTEAPKKEKQAVIRSAEGKNDQGSEEKGEDTVVAYNSGTGVQENLNDQDDRSIKMIAAPDTGLSEDSASGSLPRISTDGRQPWQSYARPFNTADKRPRIAIVIVDLGLTRVATDAAINRLPANVTLAFDTQSPVVGAWGARARQDGHETLLQLPMEPFDYPRSDPGPNTLLTTLPNTDNLERLYANLRQATGYVGITTLSGSRFTTDPGKLGAVLDILRQRGLMIFDARVAPHSAIIDMARNMHVPAVKSTSRIDLNASPESIRAALDQLEKTARLTGRAIGIAAPLPVVIDQLEAWLAALPEHGVALAPLSAMVE